LRHEFSGEVDQLLECVGGGNVEPAGETDEVSEVHCLYGRGPRGLSCELMPAARIACVSDDENSLLLSNKARLCSGTPLVVRIPV
jgi:hypothetical protein